MRVTIPLSRRRLNGIGLRYEFRIWPGQPRQYSGFFYYGRKRHARPHQVIWTKVISWCIHHGFIYGARPTETVVLRKHFDWRRRGIRL